MRVLAQWVSAVMAVALCATLAVARPAYADGGVEVTFLSGSTQLSAGSGGAVAIDLDDLKANGVTFMCHFDYGVSVSWAAPITFTNQLGRAVGDPVYQIEWLYYYDKTTNQVVAGPWDDLVGMGIPTDSVYQRFFQKMNVVNVHPGDTLTMSVPLTNGTTYTLTMNITGTESEDASGSGSAGSTLVTGAPGAGGSNALPGTGGSGADDGTSAAPGDLSGSGAGLGTGMQGAGSAGADEALDQESDPAQASTSDTSSEEAAGVIDPFARLVAGNARSGEANRIASSSLLYAEVNTDGADSATENSGSDELQAEEGEESSSQSKGLLSAADMAAQGEVFSVVGSGSGPGEQESGAEVAATISLTSPFLWIVLMVLLLGAIPFGMAVRAGRFGVGLHRTTRLAA